MRREQGRVILWLLGMLLPQRRWLALGIGIALVTVFANMGLLALTSWFVAVMAAAGAAGVAINYLFATAGIRGLALLRTGGRYLERLVTHEGTFRVLSGLRIWLYRRLEPLAPALTEQYQAGELLSRLRADVDTLDDFYIRGLVPALVALFGLAGTGAFLAAFSPLLSATTLLFLLTAGLAVPAVVRKVAMPAGRQLVETASSLRSAAVDGVRGLGELMALGAHQRQRAWVQQLGRAHFREGERLNHLAAVSAALATACSGLAAWTAIRILVPLIRAGRLPAVQLGMLVVLVMASFEAVAGLPRAFELLGKALAAARRVSTLAEASPAVAEPRRRSPRPRHWGVLFEGVRFRYSPEREWALQGVSFEVPSGGRVALVGPSGSGKSTVVNLLLRFWEYQRGAVHVGGHELRLYRSEALRRQIAVVPQSPYLFHSTIRENLLLANPRASRAALLRAVEGACIRGFIEALPEGYDTQVGEAGLRLSAGEARRLAIARALLKEAPILVLDEPTEGLDGATARSVLQAVCALSAKRTLLLITHRPFGLADMESVVVLEAGRVIAQGSHQALLAQRIGYRRLWGFSDAG
jgi:ATP-binding cassette subfamily C protein CydC